jgi:diguanylate cyclase (GGDEF)-like protein
MSARLQFETAVWATIAVIGWAVCAYFNVADIVGGFMSRHAAWQLDDFFAFVVILSIATFVTSLCQSRHHLKVRKAAEEEAFTAARRDGLTGLPNRRMFLELAGKALGEAWQSEHRCAVLFVDLDGFKPVNDTLGHAAGDALLVAVGNRLQQCSPRGALAARLGGDEFAVLLTDTEGAAGDPVLAAKVILAGLQHPFRIGDREVAINASIGVASGPENGRRAEDLTTAADIAMYEAKRAGRGTIRVFQPKQEPASNAIEMAIPTPAMPEAVAA